MRPAALASGGSCTAVGYEEITDSTTMTHGTDGLKVPSTGFNSQGVSFGSLANTGYRSATIYGVYTGVGNLYVTLSGNRSQDYFDRVTITLGTFNQSAATHSYNGTSDITTWLWLSAGTFSSFGTSTVDLIY